MKYKLRHETIVISLSTTPYRIDKMDNTIDSILAQNAAIKAIYLSIPYTFKRDNIEYVIPEKILNNNKITIIRSDDYGPATKLLGLLAEVKLDLNTIIVTLDDDVIYPKNLVLRLAYKSLQHPDRAIGIIGANIDYDQAGNIPQDSALGIIKIKQADALVNILQGYSGVLYRRHFFDKKIFAITQAPQDCINSDDIYISFYLAQNGIPRQVLQNNYINACNIGWNTPTGTDQFSLHNLNPKPTDKHRNCIKYLKNKYANVSF